MQKIKNKSPFKRSDPLRNKPLFLVFFLLCAAGVSFTTIACAGKPSDKKTAVPAPVAETKTPAAPTEPPAQPQSATAVPTVNPITQAAVQNGVLACTSRVNQVSSFLINNNQSGAFLFTNKQQPDQHIFSASIEVRPANSLPVYASASFVPNPVGGCDASYDTVEYTDQACADLGAKAFKGGQPGKLKQDILVYNTGAVKYFLMPAGKGCVIIKKETVQ